MMEIVKAYKFRLYPTEEQKNKTNQTIGSARFIYNKMLEDKINYYNKNKKLLNNTPAQYKKDYKFLNISIQYRRWAKWVKKKILL